MSFILNKLISKVKISYYFIPIAILHSTCSFNDEFEKTRQNIIISSIEDIIVVDSRSIEVTGEIKDQAVPFIDYGHIWSSETNIPEVYNASPFITRLGNRALKGTFNSDIVGLTGGKVYYLRAYAILDNQDTIYALDIEEFETTKNVQGDLRLVGGVSQITSNSAIIRGFTNVPKSSITRIGHIWDTSSQPTFENACFDCSTKLVVTNVDDVGQFSSTLTNLEAGSSYYVRAYLIESTLTEPIYSNDVLHFTTLD